MKLILWISPFTEVLKHHGSRLTEYERQEIDKFPDIWYLGLDSCKINAKPGSALNSGYDDDNGSYNKVSKLIICWMLYIWLGKEN